MEFKVIATIGLVGCGSLFSQSIAQTFEFVPNTKDTINYTDVIGKKQKHWILYGKHKPNTCYTPQQKVEEGDYKENRKIGTWTEFYCNGQMKNKITFVNGRADGYAIIYYENGKVQEEGQWKNNRWVGSLKQYYENGQVQHDFKYNEAGKREGEQVYKYDNGQVAIQGNFANGKETGTIKEFAENGQLKAEKTFNDGNVDVNSIKTYSVKADGQTADKLPNQNDAPKLVVKAEEKPNDAVKAPTILNGKHTLYDKNKNVTKDGTFENNTFIEGKAYIYNENGILTRVLIYKNGKYIGDGVIEK
jgi:antitoxin component YwqK of YwqJK toxin-antitoxin module